MNLFKLAIPAFIFTLISENIVLGYNEIKTSKEDIIQTYSYDELRKNERNREKSDFLPRTFWSLSEENIISYLEPQILITKLYNHIPFLANIGNPPENWPQKDTFVESHFLNLIYTKISNFMILQTESMPSLEAFQDSLGYQNDNKDSKLINWISKSSMLQRIAFREFEREYGYEPFTILCRSFCDNDDLECKSEEESLNEKP